MSARTDPRSIGGSNATDSTGAPASAPRRKPRISLFIATACGLGYLPKAPGTWGSLGGLALAVVPLWGLLAILDIVVSLAGRAIAVSFTPHGVDLILWLQIGLAVLVGIVGVQSARVAGKFWNLKDPQRVVIDEVSGQHLTLLFGCALPIWRTGKVFSSNFGLGLITIHSALNWKYLVLGFILFRVFDIWKPFPARQAEALPGGWGIMADDWIAGIYAGLGLWMARALGL